MPPFLGVDPDMMNSPPFAEHLLAMVALVAILARTGPAEAVDYAGSPFTYRELLKRLQPGDRLQLAPGTYRRGLPVHFMNGTDTAPIVIEGPAHGPSARFVGPANRNTVSIIDSSHVQIRRLVLQGLGRTGDAVKAEGFARCTSTHHVTLEELKIYGYDGNQQRVGISTKCPAWNWVIRRNVIVGAGTGMYLGNSDGTAPFFRGLIEYNVVADTMGYNLQIKHQLPRGYEIPEMPEDDGATIIRHNVFSKARGAGDDRMARPNVLVGHTPYAGPGLEDRYQIYGNFFYQNPHEALFQGEGNITLYNNLFVNSHDTEHPAIAIRPHHWVPRRVDVFNNTIVARGRGISLKGAAARCLQRVYGNIVFAGDGARVDGFRENLTRPYEFAADFLNKPFANPGELDLYPRADAAFPQFPVTGGLAEGDTDFNGVPRRDRLPGAYAGRGRNPGRLPTLQIKPAPRAVDESQH